ncbi:MAG: S41 family peptidase [Oscillospiraceae bacterium]|nr:S41 family peptidase [Oscillospiraceae bacterium]
MNKKISVGVAISLIAIACTVTFVVTWTIAFNMYNNMIPVSERDEINSKMQEIDSFLRSNFLYHDEIDKEKLAYGIFSGYISGAGDKNMLYMTREEYANRLNIENGQIITPGIKAEKDGSDYIKVVEVYSGSDAENKAVLPGDIITSVDGSPVLEIGQDAAIKLIESGANPKVDVVIQREGEVIEYSLTRQPLPIVSVGSVVVNNVGFIRITDFSSATAGQFEAELNAMNSSGESGIRALIIDVRANSSDVYAPIPDMLGRLIGENTVAHTEHRGGLRKDFISTQDLRLLPDIPIVVLCDSGTSGAGELFAASLKLFGGAQIVGSKTAGNSYLQETQPLKDGSAIRVTVAKIVLAGELDYADTGLVPDYEVESAGDVSYNLETLSRAGDIEEISQVSDLQIRKAFEILETITTNVVEDD